MSRTLKDTRAAKQFRREKNKVPVVQKYQKAKRNGFLSTNYEEDYCPECGGLTDFTNGFLVCTDCNWSTFETKELNFMNLNFSIAI